MKTCCDTDTSRRENKNYDDSGMKTYRIALAGSPNVGKSTLFHTLTKAAVHIANYPGVTVETKTSSTEFNGKNFIFTDIPGIYSMNAFSPEEIVASSFIANNRPDMILNIVDAGNLERNLFLTLQLMEMKVPMLLFLNMMDNATGKGIKIDEAALSKELGIPVMSGVAREGIGAEEILKKCEEVAEKQEIPEVKYSSSVMCYIEEIKAEIAKKTPEKAVDWRAVRLIEGTKPENGAFSEETLENIHKIIEKAAAETGHKVYSMIMIQERYSLIHNILRKSTSAQKGKGRNFSDKIDRIVLHEYLSLPIFLLMLFVIFQIVFAVGDPLTGLIEDLFDALGALISGFWPEGSGSLLKSLIVDGIIGGVGGVLGFTPQIFLVFLFIAFLEDCGYMARVAVIMDKWMGKIGLSGKSFMPMVLGFGCNVPAIMGARIIENKFERYATIAVIPFMSCGARLPVYILLISALIPQSYQALAMMSMYVVGVVVAAAVAKLLRLTLFRGEENPLLIELPDYEKPTFKSVWSLTWQRGKHYLEKAGTIILFTSIVCWVLNTFPQMPDEKQEKTAEKEAAAQIEGNSEAEDFAAKAAAAEYSFAGRIGHALEPVFGVFGADWKASSAFVMSLAAKEIFVSQLAILNSMGEDGVEDGESEEMQEKMRETYSIAAAIAMMLFILLSAPCFATFAIVRAETNSWVFALTQFAGMTLLAYLVACLGYFIFA